MSLKKLRDIIHTYPVLSLFAALLILFTAADLIAPDRDYSELENKMLEQRPAFDLTRLLNNEWTADYGDYVKEQFFLRDSWIDLQSRCESLIFQKCEVDGMVIGGDNLFTKMFSLKESEEKQLPKNISTIVEFAQKHPGQVTFLLAPSASLIYQDTLPCGTPMLDEDEWLNKIFQEVGTAARVVDVRDSLSADRSDYLYYRTDHHWTTDGAYLAYLDYCAALGKTPAFDPAQHERLEVPDFYGTSYSASRYWAAIPDVITYYDLPNSLSIYKVTGENSFELEETTGLYDEEKFATRDKYGAFLHGNNGFSSIEGDGTGRVLVIKDSYANCFIPYLTADYQQIDVIDLRNYSYSLDALIEQNQYDDILILYNFQSFKADTFLSSLLRPSTLA